MKTHANFVKALLPFFVIAAMLPGLTACQPQETDVPFETVLKGDIDTSYGTLDLMLAANSTEAQQIVDTLQTRQFSEELEEIINVNYEEYLVIVVILGAWPYGGAEITVERISQVGQDFMVVVSTVEPTDGDRVIVHPVHVIKIRRADLALQGQVRFNLCKGDELVLTREHFVP